MADRGVYGADVDLVSDGGPPGDVTLFARFDHSMGQRGLLCSIMLPILGAPTHEGQSLFFRTSLHFQAKMKLHLRRQMDFHSEIGGRGRSYDATPWATSLHMSPQKSAKPRRFLNPTQL